jgi:hypothetical protein
MKKLLFVWLAALCCASSGPLSAQANPEVSETGEAEVATFASITAMRDLCKELQPDKAADLDASFTKNTADVPPKLLEYSKTEEFKNRVSEASREYHSTKDAPEQAARIKSSCDYFLQVK